MSSPQTRIAAPLAGLLLCGLSAAFAQEDVRLEGTVTDSARGAPVAGVRLTALIDNRVQGTAQTDDAGHYALDLAPGIYDLAVQYFAGNILLPQRLSLRLDAVEVASDGRLEVQVPALFDLSIRFVDQSGQPVTLVELNNRPADGGGLRPDTDGRLGLRLPAGDYVLWANPFRRLVSLARQRVEFSLQDDTELAVVLTPGFVFSGVVVDPDGKPLPGASLQLTGFDFAFMQSDEEGRFSVALPDEPATYRLNVTPPGHSALYARLIDVALEGDLELEVRLQGGVPTAYFAEATATHLPVDRLAGLSMDAEAADLDGDGDADLLIAHEFRPNILLLNDGDGRFADASAERLPSRNRDSEDIALADYDLDGDLDAVVVSEDDRLNEFYLNDGAAAFEIAVRLPVEGVSNAVEAADFDGDGDADLAIGNGGRTGEQNALLLNDGAGFFVDASARLPARVDTTQDLAVGDVDNDGDLDMAVANEDDNGLLLNDGDGTFSFAEVPLRTEGEETRQAALGDVDGDGDLDLFFANVRLFNRGVASAQNRLLANDGSGRYTDVTAERLPADEDSSFDGMFADLDGDGDLDLVTSNAFPVSPYRAYRNDGTGRFAEATALFFPAGFSGEGFDAEAADVDGDGRLDLYFCSRGGTDRLLLGLSLPTAVAQQTSGPAALRLAQNVPNPFNGQTAIDFALERPGRVRLEVFNSAGQQVRTLAARSYAGGVHTVLWDGRDEAGAAVSSGVYFYRLQVGDRVRNRRLVLLR